MNPWQISSLCSNTHKKRCQRGKSKQAVKPSVNVSCVATGEHGFVSSITESMFAVSIQIKQQPTVLKKMLSIVGPLHIILKNFDPHNIRVVFNNRPGVHNYSN